MIYRQNCDSIVFHYTLDNNNILLQDVKCPADETFQQIVQTAVTKLYQSLAPPQVDT